MIFLIKKLILSYRFKRLQSSCFLNSFNRILMTNISSKHDHLIDLEELDDNFMLAYAQFKKNDNLDFIFKVITMNYFLDLLITNGYEVKLIDNKNISVFKKNRSFRYNNKKEFLLKDNFELKIKYLNKIKDL